MGYTNARMMRRRVQLANAFLPAIVLLELSFSSLVARAFGSALQVQ